jgi:RimJ/RimL family protein N-acetyltransferase
MEVQIREVRDSDLELFFEHQRDPDATAMAAFPARERDAFMAHWASGSGAPGVIRRAVVVDAELAGNVVSWEDDVRLVGYWIGRDFWGRGVATEALTQFLRQVTGRPIYAHVAVHNTGSIRVLEKCGFQRTDPPFEDEEEIVLVLHNN